MKVRDLVAGSIFTPGAGYTAEPAPRVSVILPTFRRGDSDMLRRAIDSVLSQSLRELELIIVDDGSTDSTASVIADAMANDPRVSVIRHPRNIGLPAVSEYEGYVRARGDRIAFAFDDTVFYPGSLEALLAQSDAHPDAAIAGYFEVFYRTTPDGPLCSTPLGLDADLANLLWRNVIPNGAVMLPRQIIEVVGLYDPHISLARLCDYDLWLRVRRRFPIRTVNVCVGEEHGPATVDSLGSTYPLDSWLADDRMRQERDALLLPEHFGDVDVTSWEVFTSERSIANCVRIASAHAAARGWEQPDPPQFSVDDPVARVAIVAPNVDASVQTMFHGMRDVPDVHIRYLDHARESVTTLAHADAVIVSRRAEGLVRWALAAREAGLSAIFHIDDHFPLMFQSGELDPRCAADFSEDGGCAAGGAQGLRRCHRALGRAREQSARHRSARLGRGDPADRAVIAYRSADHAREYGNSTSDIRSVHRIPPRRARDSGGVACVAGGRPEGRRHAPRPRAARPPRGGPPLVVVPPGGGVLHAQ